MSSGRRKRPPGFCASFHRPIACRTAAGARPSRQRRSRLFAIKRGEVALSEVLAEADAMAPDLEAARDVSTLPKRPDVARIDAILRRIGEELAHRWITRAEGPFGKDAPPAPEVVWNE